MNWHALQHQGDILFRNHRQVNILKTLHLGRLAFVEVGAMSVGRIQQVHPYDKPFCRGNEKSVFRWGGSAIVVFGEREPPPIEWTPVVGSESQEVSDGRTSTTVVYGRLQTAGG